MSLTFLKQSPNTKCHDTNCGKCHDHVSYGTKHNPPLTPIRRPCAQDVLYVGFCEVLMSFEGL